MRNIILLLLLSLFLVSTSTADAADRSRFSPVELAEMEQEANRLGLSLDEFIDTYATNHVDQPVNVNVIGFVVIALLLISVVVAWFFWEKIKKKKDLENTKKAAAFDDIRKHAIRELYNGVVRFYKKNKRIPSESEFRDIEYSLAQTIKSDPLEGEIVPGNSQARFGYHFSNRNPATLDGNKTYFKVWTYLHDGKMYGFSPKQ